MQATATRVRTDAKALDFTALSADIRAFRDEASSAANLTSDPLWSLLTHVPLIGPNAKAVSWTSAVLDSLGRASEPLAATLPGLQPSKLKGPDGSFNLSALQGLGPAVVSVSSAVDQARASMAQIGTAGLIGKLSHGISQLKSALDSIQPPLHGAAPVLSVLPALLGADGQRTWFVGLENLAEARGTGGFMGGFALVTTDHGSIKLATAASISTLSRSRIPTSSLPAGLVNMWGSDLTEWAGLNLSPHFPYTGSLVVDGWKARGGVPLDGVVFLDQPTVAALLTGTGPVTVRGTTISSSNVVQFLTKDVYARYPNVADKDAVAIELVRAVFARLSAGQFDLVKTLKALRGPAGDGGVLAYSTRPNEEAALANVSLGGVLPDTPGPTAMAVINNGSGNKLERYLKVAVDYVQGDCVSPVRTGDITVVMTNTAPRAGLPAYVTERNDLLPGQARPPLGSTREILDVYGPVDSTVVGVSLDGLAADFSIGVDRQHPTWRIDVEINPGQTRTIDVQFLQQVDPQTSGLYPQVLAQPMVNPQTIRVEPGGACTQ
jgi:hypothetical protein